VKYSAAGGDCNGVAIVIDGAWDDGEATDGRTDYLQWCSLWSIVQIVYQSMKVEGLRPGNAGAGRSFSAQRTMNRSLSVCLSVCLPVPTVQPAPPNSFSLSVNAINEMRHHNVVSGVSVCAICIDVSCTAAAAAAAVDDDAHARAVLRTECALPAR